jgi:hypothetical protein
MSYVLRIKDPKNTQTIVDGLKRYFPKHNVDGEVYFSDNLVAVGIKNPGKDFFETPFQVSHEHALFLERMGIGCEVLEFGEYEQLSELLQKYNIKPSGMTSENHKKFEIISKGLNLLEKRRLVERQGDMYSPTPKFNQLLEKYFFSNPNQPYVNLLVKIVDECEPAQNKDELLQMVMALDGLMNRVVEIKSENKTIDRNEVYKFFEEKMKEHHR